MLSKLFRSAWRLRPVELLVKRLTAVTPKIVRWSGNLIPPSQYDIPFPNKLRLGYAMRVHWEIIPVIVTTAFVFGVLFIAIIWACRNKVDVVWSTHSRDNISRTMDLRHPTVHKMLIINQRYEPWPEMQDVLDKMKVAEKRALLRAQSCSHP